MKKLRRQVSHYIGVSGVLLAALSSCSREEQLQVDQEALETEARQITQRFVGTLLPTLQQALQEGGPAGAIEVCSTRAPQIAATLSEDTGWQVGRVSLKARNHSLATPDEWEAARLEEFDQRQQAGEPGPSLFTSALVDGEFRYMQAQPVMPLCLNCHGSDLSEEVRSALQDRYPDDLATGYSLGQIRGAISLSRQLN